jgi:hypothetical protein
MQNLRLKKWFYMALNTYTNISLPTAYFEDLTLTSNILPDASNEISSLILTNVFMFTTAVCKQQADFR